MQEDNKFTRVVVSGAFLTIIGLCILFAFNVRGIIDARPGEFSKSNMLQALWHQYKNNYLETGTLRSLDKQQESITTSEGQSYTMLRAVWMDDKETFDVAWQWTKDNMQRSDDHLMSWLFGKRADGSYGILTDRGGYNTATDADQDIALALLYASKRWNDEKYYGDAIVIIRDIWEKEVVIIDGKPYLAANDIEKSLQKTNIIVNPSYLSPYTYKVFAQADPDNNWTGLVETSYEVAARSIEMNLDKRTSAHLPPDWIMINRESGEILHPPANSGLTTNFSFDAMRLPWRFALDYKITNDQRAKDVLSKIGFVSDEWASKGKLFSSYTHDGVPLMQSESASMYGGVLGYFMVLKPEIADEIYSQKLEGLYDTTQSRWAKPQGYYDDNWAWFGMALYAGEAVDLYGLNRNN